MKSHRFWCALSAFIRTGKVFLIFMLFFSQFSHSAFADTLDNIKSKGSMTFGIVTDQPPYGFINEKGQNDGYDIEIARMMAKELGVTPKFVPITASNRIPLLLTGKVDMLICVLGMYPDRAKVIQYLKPYAASAVELYAAKGTNVKSLAELAGHNVAVARGSSVDKMLTSSAPAGTNIQRFDDDSSAIQSLVSGQSDVLAGYSNYFLPLQKASPNKFESKATLEVEYLGIAVRPNQKAYTDWANNFLDKNQTQILANYKKWFGIDRPALPAELPGIPFSVK
ncbi:transporter substrate-binding domain-containing protein [Pantoea cypripedii]|uniref:Amino acid ABC transporter substrate-binding protein n=1 Tax=Pantoea cypripedii TaxID=55209 RepID=A0A6B9G6H7_PANCY|nr:transporter substrate-binding domain-containing protein [Pantoea cypripedii]QGY33194.1 amino acid ABC transporter substrate-binding protein [Pantoea cypripedii]